MKRILWERLALPVLNGLARKRLATRMAGARRLRVAIVKQDCNEDLYCAAPGASARDTIESTLLRSGPASLFTLFDTKFHIVRTEADAECNIWKEKSDPLQWAPVAWFESFRTHVPGRNYGQDRYAVAADEINWDEFDLVIGIDVPVPARITARHPNVVWAYYVRELKAPSWAASFKQAIAGQDLYLNHSFSPRRTGSLPHVIDFPYHFQQCGVFNALFETPETQPAARRGIFVEYHTSRAASDAQLEALKEFGPVVAERATDDRIDAVTNERIPRRSMEPDARAALLQCKYHVKWDGRAVYGTAKVEAIAAGCLAIYPASRDGSNFLQSEATSAEDFESMVKVLRRLESEPGLYRAELGRQQRLVDYLCYLRPANDLLDAIEKTRRRKSTVRSG